MAKTANKEVARMKALYNDSVREQLMKDLKLDNINQVPRVEKIVVSVGLGRGKDDKRLFEIVRNTLRKITGQEPVDIMAKKSIANFKIREGLSRIGIKVTLRDKNMYEFYDRLVSVVLPRVRDFHGVSVKSFDPQGNYSLGFKDQSIFPELGFEDTTTLHGLQVTFVISGGDKKYSHALLAAMNMPFEKKELK